MYFQYKINGNEITVDLAHHEEIEKGQTWNLSGIQQNQQTLKWRVTKVNEKRLPGAVSDKNPNNVNHHPDGVFWYQATADIIR